MKIAVTDYAKALYELVSDKPEVAKQTIGRFVGALRRQGKSKLLPSILAELSRVEAKQSGQLTMTVTSPSALSGEQHAALRAAVTSAHPNLKSVDIEELIDPSILGGIKVKIGDSIIDHTIQTKLNILAAKL